MSFGYPPPLLSPAWERGLIATCAIGLFAAWYLLWRQTFWKANGWRCLAWLLGGVFAFRLSWWLSLPELFVGALSSLIWATSLTGALAAIVPRTANHPGRILKVTWLTLFAFGVVFLLMAPSLMDDREAANRYACRNNLNQIGGAIAYYQRALKVFPRPTTQEPPQSWRVDLYLWLRLGRLSGDYDKTKAWDETPNNQLASHRQPVYVCPTDIDPIDIQGRWYTAYAMLTGPGTLGQSDKMITEADITDGTAATISVVEACGAKIVWTESRDIDISDRPVGVNLPGESPGTSRGWLSSCHAGGAHALMADGGVRFINQTIDEAVLRGLATIAGGETASEF